MIIIIFIGILFLAFLLLQVSVIKESFRIVFTYTPVWVWLIIGGLSIYYIVEKAQDDKQENSRDEYHYRFTDRWLKEGDYRVYWVSDPAFVGSAVTSSELRRNDIITASKEIKENYPDMKVVFFHLPRERNISDIYAIVHLEDSITVKWL